MENGSFEMTYSEFLHALTPYQHGELKNNSVKYLENKKPSLLKLVDSDKSETISFAEFYFFLTLL